MDMLDRMQTGRFKVFKHLNDWFEEFRLYHRKDGGLQGARRLDVRHPLRAHDAALCGDNKPAAAAFNIASRPTGWMNAYTDHRQKWNWSERSRDQSLAERAARHQRGLASRSAKAATDRSGTGGRAAATFWHIRAVS